jgi:hypothetical protein
MLSRIAVGSLALVSGAFLSSGALAEEQGVTGCLHMQKQVSQALDSNQQSANYYDANALKRAGQEFCTAGLYTQGLARYAKALQLLGVEGAQGPASAANSGTSTAR